MKDNQKKYLDKVVEILVRKKSISLPSLLFLSISLSLFSSISSLDTVKIVMG
jgi:hypothetical protein